MNKKKIGVLTFHRIWNAGAFLLTVSLCERLKNDGFEPIVLDYHPKGITKALEFRFGRNPLRWMSGIKNTLYARRMYRIYGDRQSDFKRSPRIQIARDVEQLGLAAVVASADVWNYDTIWCREEGLFFGEGLSSVPLVGYGISLGKTDFRVSPPSETLKNHLQNFDHVFPRDQLTKEFSEKFIGSTHPVTLDPAFFCNVKSFVKERPMSERYLAVYALRQRITEDVEKEIVDFARKRGLKIIAPAYSQKFADSSIPYINAYEWLNYLYHADAVFSGTFHGTVFSILMEKPFAVQAHADIGQKTISMVNNLGYTARLYEPGNLVDVLSEEFEPKSNCRERAEESFEELSKILQSLA